MQEAEFRARLTEAGPGQQADALIGLGLPAVRLRTRPTPGSEEEGYRVTPAAVARLAGPVTAVASDRGGPALAVVSDGSVAAWGHTIAVSSATEPGRTPTRRIDEGGVGWGVAVRAGARVDLGRVVPLVRA